MDYICFTCDKFTDCKKCSICKMVYYCSIKCQKEDFKKRHKTLCSEYKVLREYQEDNKLMIDIGKDLVENFTESKAPPKAPPKIPPKARKLFQYKTQIEPPKLMLPPPKIKECDATKCTCDEIDEDYECTYSNICIECMKVYSDGKWTIEQPIVCIPCK